MNTSKQRLLEVDDALACTVPDYIVHPEFISVLLEKMKSIVVVRIGQLEVSEASSSFPSPNL